MIENQSLEGIITQVERLKKEERTLNVEVDTLKQDHKRYYALNERLKKEIATNEERLERVKKQQQREINEVEKLLYYSGSRYINTQQGTTIDIPFDERFKNLYANYITDEQRAKICKAFYDLMVDLENIDNKYLDSEEALHNRIYTALYDIEKEEVNL